ncbi:MAG: response regulator [Magnetococcales bacterium]|nr:response regulator [Magnetococcales bacterium]
MENDSSSLPIVLVDDEVALLRAMEMSLFLAGLGPIKTISDSRNVMPFLAENGARIVILDIEMPFIQGTEILNKIVKDFPNIPVVILSAITDSETVGQCIKKGAVNFLIKPLERDELVEVIKNVIDQPLEQSS